MRAKASRPQAQHLPRVRDEDLAFRGRPEIASAAIEEAAAPSRSICRETVDWFRSMRRALRVKLPLSASVAKVRGRSRSNRSGGLGMMQGEDGNRSGAVWH